MLHRPHHTIGANEVHVWHWVTDPLANEPVLNAVCTLLAPQEQSRMERIAKHKDRMLYACSRALMRTVLASYLSCKCQDICFSANAFGKPTLQTECGAPELLFNLTHSRGAIALAVSKEREVGIDVEERYRIVEYLPLAERFFAASEARYLQQMINNEQRREAFFAIWTLKEAFVKGIGRGLSFPLDAFCFDLQCNRLLAFRPLADFVSPEWHFQQFELGERYCGAVAVHNCVGQQVHIEMREWDRVFLSGSIQDA